MSSVVIRANPVLNFEEYTLTCVPADSHGWAEAVFSEERGDERANEGPHTFTFRLRAPENTLKELFARGLMRQVEVWDDRLNNEFQGYIHEMVYVVGMDRYTINLDNMLNKVFMRADYDGDGAVERSTTLENTASQDRFGTKEGVLSGGELEGLTVADQAVQAFIDRRGFPLPEPDLGGGGDGPFLEVFCRGYMNTLDWVLYNQTASTGTQGMSTQVSDIIGDRAAVAIAQPATFDSAFDWSEGRPTDADALSPDWDHTVLDALADADSKTDADGDLNEDDGTETPSTESGGIIYSSEHAAYGQAIQLADATTNLVTNPSFENDTSGWTKRLGGDSITRVTSDAYVGSAAAEIDASGGGGGAFHAFSGAAGTTYTLQARFKEVTAGVEVEMLLWDDDTGFQGVGTLTATGDWQLLSGTATTGASSTSWRIYLATKGTFGAGTFLADAAQIEAKAYPTPYCDGSLGTGHSWSGSAHASTSSRTATDLQYSLDLPSQFTIRKTIAPLTLPSEISADGWYWQWRVDANNLIGLRADASSDAVIFEWIGAGTSSRITDADLTRFQQYEYTVTYDGSTVTLYRDGSSVGTISGPTAHGSIPNILHLGGVSGASHANGWLDEFVVDARAWNSGKVSAHNARSSAFSDEALLYMDFDTTADGENFIVKLGSNGFKVDFDDTNAAYITVNATSVDQTEQAVDIYFNPRNIIINDGAVVQFVQVDSGTQGDVLHVEFRRSSGVPQVEAVYREDSGTQFVVGSGWVSISSKYVHLRLVSKFSTGAGNDDGFCYFLVDDGGEITTQVDTGIDNDTHDWDNADVGMVFTNATTQGGSFAFDEVRVSESVSPAWIAEAAARDGSYGAAFTIEDTTARYVEDQEPTNATEIARELWLRPPGTMATDDEFHVMTLREDGGAVDAARVILGYDGTDYYVKISARLDGGSYTTSDKTIIHPLYTNHLRIHWLASSGVGNDDGRMYLFQRDNQRPALTGLDNDTLNVDTIREGAVAGLDSGTSGVLFLDTQRHSTESLITVTSESGVGEFIASKDLDANATTVTKEYDADRRALAILQSLWSLGDSNNNRWVGRMRGKTATTVVGREFVLQQAAPTEVPEV